MKFRLSEEDAAALGCPREVEFDETRFTVKENIALQKQTGFTMERLGYFIEGVPARGRDGSPLYLLDEAGVEKLDEQGRKIPLREMDAEAIAAAVWLAVRRAGAEVAFDDFDINLVGVEFLGDEEDPGKANRAERRAAAKTSKPSSRATSRSSPRSTASTRGTSHA